MSYLAECETVRSLVQAAGSQRTGGPLGSGIGFVGRSMLSAMHMPTAAIIDAAATTARTLRARWSSRSFADNQTS
jgi:hypothetical protein